MSKTNYTSPIEKIIKRIKKDKCYSITDLRHILIQFGIYRSVNFFQYNIQHTKKLKAIKFNHNYIITGADFINFFIGPNKPNEPSGAE